MTRNLRYRILSLLKDYAQINEQISLGTIIALLPDFSYKSIQFQLCYLQNKGYVSRLGTKANYQYYITKEGLQRLGYLEDKKLKREMIEAFALDLALYNSFM